MHQTASRCSVRDPALHLMHELSRLQACVLALILAIGLVVHVYPWSFITGHATFFERGDAAHHVVGWLAYVADDWRFPLMRTLALNPPDGINIIFTDSIPLAALLFKLFRSVLPDGFHYFGWWHAFTYLAQALAAVCLLRALGVRHLLGTMVGVGFALISPVLIFRIGHTALATHALLLLAMASCWMGLTGQWRSQKAYAWLLVLTIVTMLVHAYLMGMVLLFLLLLLVELWRQGEPARRQVQRFAGIVAAIGVVGWLFGYWGTNISAQGFGIYSMNLLSPFCGQGIVYACGFDETGGQYEGYNYLGIGTMVVVIASIACCRTEWRSTIRTQGGFFALLLLLTLFAVSNEIYFGTVKLAAIPLPHFLEKLFNVFRASGRFFWPVGYALLFISLALMVRRPNATRATVVLVALAVQWWDTTPLRSQQLAHTRQEYPLPNTPWEDELTGIDSMMVYPPYQCPSHAGQEEALARLERAALQKKVTMNTVFYARGTTNCEQQLAPFRRTFEVKQLYLVPAEYSDKDPLPAGFQLAVQNGHCALREDALICRTDYDRQRWLQLAGSRQRMLIGQWSASERSAKSFPGTLPKIGQLSSVQKPEFVSGWSAAEPWGRWSDGSEAILSFDVAAAPKTSTYRLTIEARIFPSADRREMRVMPWVNGRSLPVIAFSSPGVAQAQMDIPAAEVAPGMPLTVVLQFDQPTSPCLQKVSEDCRLLGIGVQSIRLETL